jgi:hypothetical protein
LNGFETTRLAGPEDFGPASLVFLLPDGLNSNGETAKPTGKKFVASAGNILQN